VSDPVTVNIEAAAVDAVIRDSIMEIGPKAAAVALQGMYPTLMKIPGVSWAFSAIASFVAGQIYAQIAIPVIKSIIDGQTTKEAENLKAAAEGIKAANATGDSNAINNSRKNFSTAFSSLVHYDGSASP
jgi:hypothetical protein